MYNKLFSKILDSSIWLEPDPVRLVWITLLAAMDQDGYAHFSAIQNLADRAKVGLKATQEAVDKLMAPDPESGIQDHDGRRLERVPGGFLILNAKYYREMVSREVQRENTRERVRRYRERKRIVTNSNASVTPSEADTEAESDIEEKNKTAIALFDVFWDAYKEAGGEKTGRGQAEKIWAKLNPDQALLSTILEALQSQKDERAAFAAAGQFYENWKHPATWLRAKCWTDEPRNLDKVIHAQPRRLSGPEQVERATAERKRERDQKLIR